MQKLFLFFFAMYSGIFVFGQRQNSIGINTKEPRATLDIEGELRVTKLGDYFEEAIPLGWDPVTQKLVKNIGTKSAEKPFYTVTYIIQTGENEDWIKNFNTKIPSDKYQVVITSAQLNRKIGPLYIKYVRQTSEIENKIAVFYYSAFVEKKTWRLKADYNAAIPGFPSGDYYWKISVLIINKKLIYSNAKRKVKVNNNGIGADIASPIGN